MDVELTLDQQFENAVASRDMALVKRLAGEIDKRDKVAEREHLDANKELIVELALKVKSKLIETSKKFEADIKELVGNDKARVKFEYDFANELDTTIAISKGPIAGARRASGGGTPQRYEKGTPGMLAEFGEQPFKKDGEDSGMTLQEAWNSNTDGNFRYKIRQQLVKLDMSSQ